MSSQRQRTFYCTTCMVSSHTGIGWLVLRQPSITICADCLEKIQEGVRAMNISHSKARAKDVLADNESTSDVVNPDDLPGDLRDIWDSAFDADDL